MKLIIDIPEWKYKSICEGIEASKRCGVVGIDPDIHEAIYNGTPLPKGHGELIDRDALREDFKTSRQITFAELLHISCIVDHASIIIEADK